MISLLRRVWPPTIRVQLTLWFILVFTVLMLLFGAVFYVNLRKSLQTSFDTSLELRTQQIAAGINDEKGTITIQDVTGALPGLVDPDSTNVTGTPLPDPLLTSTPGPEETRADVDLGALVRILNARGEVVYVTPAFLALNIPSMSVARPLHGNAWEGTVTAQNGETVRLYSAALVDGGTVYICTDQAINTHRQAHRSG